MASGRSLDLRKIQPAGPVLVAETDLPPGQHQPGPGPTRREMRARGRRSDSWLAKRPHRADVIPAPSPRALERHQRRMERRSRSVGLVMVKPPGWGAKHSRILAARGGEATSKVETPTAKRHRIRVPWKPSSRERIYLRQRGAGALTPRQLRSLRRAENRTIARARKGAR